MAIGTNIHPQAIVSGEAKLGAGVQIGAFAVVGAGVEVGDGCVLHEHAVVRGPSKFGANNVFHPFCVIGGDPQDYSFRGEHVELQVGSENIFREHVTISRGTTKGGGSTRIGTKNFFLSYSHVWHDCQALEEMRKSMAKADDVKELVEFVEKAERGIVK